MTIEQQLFEGETIRLGPIDYEKDPAVESRWTHDLSYLRMVGRELARPLSQVQVKKKYEAIEKGMEERNLIYYTIRRKQDNELLGFIRLDWIEWTHGAATMKMAIGDLSERGKGYVYRLTVTLGEDNPRGVSFFKKFGFVEEVRRRKALLRDGQTYDMLMLGLLKDEWRRA